MKRLLLLTAAVVAAGLPPGGDAEARTWRVPGDFFTLSNAVAAAVSGDVIQLAGNGGSTYPVRDLNLDKDITIEGGWRIDFAVRAPELYASVVRDTSNTFDRPVLRVVGNATVVLDGIHVVGGKYGILAVGGANLTVRDCDIHNQRHTRSESEFEPQIGTGIRMVGGTLRFEDSTIRSIRSGYPGAAMGLLDLASAQLVGDCLIDDVLSSPLSIDASGGAIYARDVSYLTMNGVTFNNCRTVHRGGASTLR